MPSRAAGRIDVKPFDMVIACSRAIDFLHPDICEHHLRTAYAAACIAEAIGVDADTMHDLLIAAALHDIAAVCSPAATSLPEDALKHFHAEGDSGLADVHLHGQEGCDLLCDFPPFAQAASAIRFHHLDWNFGRGEVHAGQPVPLISHILRLADCLSVLPAGDRPILEQSAAIRRTIAAGSGKQFHPEFAAAFDSISGKESFWLDLASRHKEAILRQRFGDSAVRLDLDGLHQLAEVFARIIDYRSSYTAMHSSGVSATSEILAVRLGFSGTEKRLAGVAGYLHDIGKLAVPPDVLDKPGKLAPQEMLVIRQHPYYTHQILSAVPGLETITTWASYHHERLDGTGYPFRPRHIPVGARIVAVADVFTALTEDRPYRAGMDRPQCLAILDRMAVDGALDGDIVAILRNEYDELEGVCHRIHRSAA